MRRSIVQESLRSASGLPSWLTDASDTTSCACVCVAARRRQIVINWLAHQSTVRSTCTINHTRSSDTRVQLLYPVRLPLLNADISSYSWYLHVETTFTLSQFLSRFTDLANICYQSQSVCALLTKKDNRQIAVIKWSNQVSKPRPRSKTKTWCQKDENITL